MEALFELILKTSAYGTAVGIILLLLKALLRHRLDARWHYLLWMVLLLKLLLPFGPQSTISLFNAVPPLTSTGIIEPSPAPPQEAPSQNTAMPVMPEPEAVSQVPEEKPASIGIVEGLPYVWAAGAGGMLLWLAASGLLLSKRLQRNAQQPSDRIRQIFQGCKEKLGIKRSISLLQQQEVSMPSLFGAARPKILLPQKAAEMEDKELEYVLLHELAHCKRGDVFVNYLLLLLQALHWFNPVMWYCFKRIREDMELATDQYVLSLLEQQEQRDYGRVLLKLLEQFSAPSLAPKLLGMADDKKSMERRLQMIKMTDFFKKRKNIVLLLGILCIALSASLLLTSRLAPAEAVEGPAAEKLYQYKNTGEIDRRKLTELISLLPYGSAAGEILEDPQNNPNRVPIYYSITASTVIEQQLKDNAAVVFSLMDKINQISFQIKNEGRIREYSYTREQIQQGYEKELREYAKDLAAFASFYEELSFKVYVSPAQYTLAMSSTPGIGILPEYEGGAVKVRYSTDRGALFTWENMSERKTSLELDYGQRVYWSPLLNENSTLDSEKITIKAELLDDRGKILKEKQIEITGENAIYKVIPAAGLYIEKVVLWEVQKPQSLEEAVAQAVKNRKSGYLEGEVATEGHRIIETHEEDDKVIAYTLASYGAFGFENGIFTKISGSGAIPTVITFVKGEKGQLTLLEYKEPMDGSYYGSSLQKMFPGELMQKLKAAEQNIPELGRQQEEQAAEYLRSIGRTAVVDAGHVEKQLADIDVEASNKLFSELAKYDEFLNNCPYWIGTRETIENDTRYIYETRQGKTDDGYDLITYRKTDSSGRMIQERKYKIVGSKPHLMP